MKKILKRILPSSVYNFLQQGKHELCRKTANSLGYNITPKTAYYSPIPNISELQENLARWSKPSKLLGIEYDIERLKKTLSELLVMYYDEFSEYPPYDEIRTKGFGQGYTNLDALALYMMIRHYKPRQYVEVGSGISTYYCSLAARKNENDGYPLQITCIEPYPYKHLYSLPKIQIRAEEVQDTERSLFQGLQEKDVLFIDSSHILKIDGDVAFLYLEVLPALNTGVIIHIHDVPFPYNIPYPPEYWILNQKWPMFWNEAMVLQAFLCNNNKFKIIMSTPLLRFFDESFLMHNIPIYQSVKQSPNTFSSIWLQKIE